MSILSSLRGKLIVFNILIVSIYILIIAKGLKSINIYDIAILTTLPIVTYLFLKKYTESI